MRDSKNIFLFFEWECRAIVISSEMRSVLELPYGSDRNIAFALFLSGISINYKLYAISIKIRTLLYSSNMHTNIRKVTQHILVLRDRISVQCYFNKKYMQFANNEVVFAIFYFK